MGHIRSIGLRGEDMKFFGIYRYTHILIHQLMTYFS